MPHAAVSVASETEQPVPQSHPFVRLHGLINSSAYRRLTAFLPKTEKIDALVLCVWSRKRQQRSSSSVSECRCTVRPLCRQCSAHECPIVNSASALDFRPPRHQHQHSLSERLAWNCSAASLLTIPLVVTAHHTTVLHTLSAPPFRKRAVQYHGLSLSSPHRPLHCIKWFGLAIKFHMHNAVSCQTVSTRFEPSLNRV